MRILVHDHSGHPFQAELSRELARRGHVVTHSFATGYVSGLEKTLRSVFPIVDFAGTAHLDFDRYELEPPKYDTDECRQRGLTYAETRPEAMTAWMEHVFACAQGLLSNEVDSWMTGVNSNVEGKQKRRIARYSGSAPEYRAWCERVAADGYVKDLVLQ